MRAFRVVTPALLPEDTPQMGFVEDKQMVQALAADAALEALVAQWSAPGRSSARQSG
jgi:hypothetical protein